MDKTNVQEKDESIVTPEEARRMLEKTAVACIELPAGLTTLEYKVQLLKDDNPSQGQIIHSYTFATVSGESVTFSIPDPQLIYFGMAPRVEIPQMVFIPPYGRKEVV